ncbi:SusC/RagA family TonB-linked outer membrane protein [Lacibacter sp. H407]|uniref:SusC/RagA family TonB-linked outer membrane protein n=1 Tax=Lacibacter sp. H407 TaxID=3133423 RepID=UPI0030C1B3CD
MPKFRFLQLRTLLLLFALTGFSSQSFSQEIKITGSVFDENNNPMKGATVSVKDSKVVSSTDAKGNFSITIPQGKNILVISFVGYETQEYTAGIESSITIKLEPSATTLNNVVVTALGFETKKDKLGYATNRISGEAVNNSGESGIIQALAGKSSGVRISRSNGDPGSGSQILIRGQSTITRSTDPLIVVDGVPISGDARGETAGGQIQQQSRLNDISMDDVANIQVLKGASAAALWGTRAANGVIVITTKKGSGGNKPTINFRSTVSFDQVSAFYDLQTTYGQGNNGVWAANAIRTWGDKIANRAGGDDILNTAGAYFVGNTGRTIYPITTKNSKETFVDKNYNDVFRTGHFLDNSISISGGDNKSNYFVSLSDLNQKGVARAGSDYRRTTFRINAGREFNKWLNFSNKTSYTLTNSNRLQGGINNAGLLIGLLRTPPDFDNSDYIGQYYSAPGGAFIPNRHRSYRNGLGSSTNPGFNNPLWVIHQLQNSTLVNRFINSAEINIKPVKWFTLTTRAGVDYFTDQQRNYFPYFTANWNAGQYNREEYSETQFNLDVIGRAEHDFTNKFSGNVLIGFNYNHLKTTTLGGQSQDFILRDGPQDLNNATPTNISTTDRYLKRITNAGYSSIGFAWDDQLFVNATGRIETASTFGELAAKTFFYPSSDIAWQFTKIKGLESLKWLSFGKLRASFGIVGVQPGSYNTMTNFTARSWTDGLGGALDPALYGTGSYLQNDDKGNPYLKPERKQEIEFGTDLRFFNNKVSLGFTVYQNETKDALISVTQSPATGFNTIYANAGTIENKGIELDLGYNVFQKNNWSLDVNMNWTRNRNLVTYLANTGSIDLGGSNGISSRAVEGYALGALFSNKFQRDSGGKFILDANGFPVLDPVAGVIGDPNPDWRAAFGFNLKYKIVYLNALFEHSQGGDVVNGTEAVLLDYGTSAATGFERTSDVALQTYRGTTIAAGTAFRGNIHNFGGGNVALDQSWYTGPGGFFGNIGEQFVEDATWTRLREVNLGVNLKNKWLNKKIGINSIGFELSGRNLLLISKVNGYDPDANNSGTTSGRGVVYFVNPPTRSFLGTIKLNF